MDPLTTLLAAAAAAGPNTIQSQALTALRSAGPQESFYTRMGNPHPLQMQQLAQPPTTHFAPITTQQPPAPTAIQQQFPMPTMPFAAPLTDPAPTALHIPTLQAIQTIQQQANPAPTMTPMMPQLHPAQAQTALPRDPTEYTQANFPSLTPRQLAVLAQLETQDQQALRSNAHNILQPNLQAGAGGSTQPTSLGHTQPTTITRPLEARSDFVPNHPQHHEGRCRRAVHPPRNATEAAHSNSINATVDPGAAAKTDTEREEPTGTDPELIDPDLRVITVSTEPSCSAAGPTGTRPAPDRGEDEQMERRQNTAVYKGDTANLQMEAGAPSTQEAAPSQQQPPSRFRPSSYTVDLNNTTNPPPPPPADDGQTSGDATPGRAPGACIVQRDRRCPAIRVLGVESRSQHTPSRRLFCSVAAGAIKRSTSVPK